MTAELSKYQELLGQDSGIETSTGQSTFHDDQSSAPQTTNMSDATPASIYSSPTSAMNVLTSGVCFRADEEPLEVQQESFVLGDIQLDRLVAYELFSE